MVVNISFDYYLDHASAMDYHDSAWMEGHCGKCHPNVVILKWGETGGPQMNRVYFLSWCHLNDSECSCLIKNIW